MRTRNLTFNGLAVLVLAAGSAAAQWSDNFDSYANGTLLDNVNGWSGWDDIGIDAATVTDAQARSAPHSAAVGNGYSDAVHTYSGYSSGQWTYTAHVYVPSDLDGITYFILNNEYNHLGPYDWAVELDMDPAAGTVRDVFRDPDGLMTAPLLYDQWVEIRVEIDLDNNIGQCFYNGAMVGDGVWNAYSGGLLEIQAVDLYAPHLATVYYDDMSLQPAGGCYADFDGNSVVDTRDVLAFLNAWNNSSDSSDCDDNDVIDTRDVLCFLNLWNAGC